MLYFPGFVITINAVFKRIGLLLDKMMDTYIDKLASWERRNVVFDAHIAGILFPLLSKKLKRKKEQVKLLKVMKKL